MRLFIAAVIILFTTSFSNYPEKSIGQMKLVQCDIKKTESVMDTISGRPVQMLRLTVVSKTKVQVRCNYGDPSKNKYETVKNVVYVSYVYDSTGIIRDSIISDIKKYADEQELWAKKYGGGNDFTNLVYLKSFFVNDSVVIPSIRTIGENPGDYQLYYIENQVYKIELAERHGSGCLSSFAHENMYFTKGDQRIELGNYIKNIDKAREIIAREN